MKEPAVYNFQKYPNQSNRDRAPFKNQGGQGFKQHRQHVQEPPKNLASALRVQNFRKLATLISEDNLAVALDLTMHRFKELLEGVNFSDEMSYHIETMLRIPSGFMDQVNPVLSDADVTRLKNPATVREHEELHSEHSTPVAVSQAAAEVQIPATEKVASVEKPESLPSTIVDEPNAPAEQKRKTLTMPPQTANLEKATTDIKELSESPLVADSTAPVVYIKRKEIAMTLTAEAPEQVVNHIELEPVSTSTRGAVSPDEEALRLVRQSNLALLTSRPGAKSQVGRLTGLSAANISHRLHGNKIFDKGTADFFCQRLALPENWFEAQRTEADIPQEYLALLSDKSFKAQDAETAPKAPRARKSAQKIDTPAPVKVAEETPSFSLSANALGKTVAVSESAAIQAPLVNGPTQQTTQPVVEVTQAPQKPAVALTIAPPAPPAPKPQVPVAAKQSAAIQEATASLGPVAEALIRTLSLKARQGELLEEKALEMLVALATI